MALCDQTRNKQKNGSVLWMDIQIGKLFARHANESLFATLMHVVLVPYLRITIVGMKKDILFEHKEVTNTYEESMDNAND